MKKRERLVWIGIVCILLIVTTASGLNNWILAGDSSKAYEQLRLFNEIFNLLRTEYYDEEKVTSENLVPGAISGMIEALDDPHTSYLTREIFNELQTDTRGEFGGLGIVIGKRDEWITVIAPIGTVKTEASQEIQPKVFPPWTQFAFCAARWAQALPSP